MVPPELSMYLSVIGDSNNTLLAHTVGDAALLLKETKYPHKELIYLPVSVSYVKYFTLTLLLILRKKSITQNISSFIRS